VVPPTDGVRIGADHPAVRADAWLTSVFARPVFQVRTDGLDPRESAALTQRHALGQTQAFYYAKVGVSAIATVDALTRAGMTVVDVNVTFGIDSSRVPAPTTMPAPAVEIRAAEDADRDEVLRIAESCFRYSRFHLDPLVPVAVANAIKREWIASYFSRLRGERLWVALMEGRRAGFLAVVGGEDGPLRHKTIDLIGVAPSFHRRGIGRALVSFFLGTYASACDRLRVGTQIANTPSTRLYEQAGFSIDGAQYVLHMHVPESLK
jgi:ribosomal protein S18 acetylase RimI-like enzyme